MTTFLLLLLVAVGVEAPSPSPPGEDETIIGFCQLPIGELHARMSGELSLTIGFTVDSNGRPQDVVFESGNERMLEGSDTREGTVAIVQPCLERWRLPKETPGTHLTATFVWRHEQGWRELRIEGGEVATVIELSGDSCPYGP